MQSLMRYITRTHRCFILYRNDQLKEEGLNGYQHLYILCVCEHPGISQDALAKAVYVNKSNVARQLFMLEEAGFITRSPSPEDRRHLLVYPTEKARAIYPRVLAVLEQWNARLLEGFSPEERTLLFSMLERVMGRATSLLEAQDAQKGED